MKSDDKGANRAMRPTRGRRLAGMLWRHGPTRYPKRWLVGSLALLLFGLALPHAYTLYVSTRWPLPDPTQRSAEDFLTLAYFPRNGTTNASPMTVERFQEHLHALSQAGYRFIGLQDVQALMRQGMPLPRRAVLVTVDAVPRGREWNAWQSAVIRARARAVLFVDPLDRSHPRGAGLRQTATTPHWDVAVAYSALFEPAMAEPDAGEGFATDVPRTQAYHYGRLHDLEQAASRHHRRLRQAMRRPFPVSAMALAYPDRIACSSGHSDCDIRCQILAQTAKPFFDMGFVARGTGLNSSRSDAMLLNRMRIPPEWSGRDLIDHLQTYVRMPFETADQEGVLRRAPWISVFGSVHMAGDYMLLQAAPHCVSGLWLAGSDAYQSFVIEANFVLKKGALRIPFLAARDESRHWELRLDSDGRVALSQGVNHYERLVAEDRWSATGQGSTLRMVRRHDQLRVALDGRSLFNGWIALNEPDTRGLLGVRVSGSGAERGEIRLHSLSIAPPQPMIALWDGPRSADLHNLTWMGNRAADITAVSPPLRWLQISPKTDSGFATLRPLVRAAARVHGWSLIPHLTLNHPRDTADWDPDALAAQVSEADGEGVLVRFAAGSDWNSMTVVSWAQATARALRERGHRFLVRWPAAGDSTGVLAMLAQIPNVERVVDSGAPPEERRAAAVEIVAPPSDPESDLRMYYDMLVVERDSASEDRRLRMEQWRELAEERFATGEEEDAIAIWFDWHEADPRNPFPLRRIGDALHRLGYQDEAAEFYRQSLERDPGNIVVAVTLAEWLDAAGHHEESRNMLHVYRLLFPDNSALLMGQAEWLLRRGRREESLVRIRRLLEQEPDHLSAALLMAQLAETPDERRTAMARLLRLGHRLENRYRILQMVREADLLAVPEAGILLSLLDMTDEEARDTRLRDLVATLTPRVTETVGMPDARETIPAGWSLDGGTARTDPGRIHIRADAGREEAFLRLSGTERWHDVFVEVDLAGQTGEFWLVARRSRDHMIRFGFEAGGDQLHLQIWSRQGMGMTMIKHQSRPWSWRMETGVRLRLEIRGNGATGTVNGEPLSAHAMTLPPGLPPGWVGMATRSIDPGRAEMTLRRIAAGPLFPTLAFPEKTATGTLDSQADRLRRLVPVINAISPSGISIDADGVWSSLWQEQEEFYRLFARYHSLRLLPRVRVENPARIDAGQLRQAAILHRVDGFVLELAHPPAEKAIQQLDRDLIGSDTVVLLLYEQGGVPVVTAIGYSRWLLPGETTGRSATVVPDNGHERVRLLDARRTGPLLIRF